MRTLPAVLVLLVPLAFGCTAASSPGGDDDPGGDPDASTAPVDDAGRPILPDAGGAPQGLPIDRLDDLSLVIIIGDSAAAGYNAPGRNDSGGQGYARLLVTNHPAYPEMAGKDLSTLYPGVDFRKVAESGATSGDALDNLRGALNGSLPASVPGDVLVLINVGGNDFNDDVQTMVVTTVTLQRADAMRANLAEMFRLLRERYADPGAGKEVVFLVNTLYDPTDDTADVPAEFDDGFCGTIHGIPLAVRGVALDNFHLFNAELESEIDAQAGYRVDLLDAFEGHGMNAGADRLIDGDCAHPTGPGHDLIRRTAWFVLTGESV